jgi:2-polyprenyl-6-methoxyphenol hydroxylase-like FAD-dependent oxidoreductase
VQALKQELRQRAIKGGTILVPHRLDTSSVEHDVTGSTLACEDGSRFRARMMLDCSGFGSRLVELHGNNNPGWQVRTARQVAAGLEGGLGMLGCWC